MQRPLVTALLGAAATAWLGWAGCTPRYDLGTDTATSSGAGGASTSATHASSSKAATTATSSSSGTGGAEPNLPTALTIVNGINDYDAVRFCFLPGDTPWPAAASGLAFAAGQVVDIATALPAGTDVDVWIVAGDLAVTAGMTCTQMLALAHPGGVADAGPGDAGAGGGGTGGGGGADGGTGGGGTDGGTPDGGNADAGPPPILAVELATIPVAVLTSDRSLLLVPSGCLGGAGHDDPNASSGCGMGYTSATPTAGAVLVGMSRIADHAHVSLQVASASPALPSVDVHLLPALQGAMEADVAPSLGPSGIGPIPPFHALELAAFGSIPGVQIKTYTPGTMQATSTTMLSAVLAHSAVMASDFADGANLVFVGVGAAPGAIAGPFWHAFTYGLVKANPG